MLIVGCWCCSKKYLHTFPCITSSRNLHSFTSWQKKKNLCGVMFLVCNLDISCIYVIIHVQFRMSFRCKLFIILLFKCLFGKIRHTPCSCIDYLPSRHKDIKELEKLLDDFKCRGVVICQVNDTTAFAVPRMRDTGNLTVLCRNLLQVSAEFDSVALLTAVLQTSKRSSCVG